MAASAQPVQPYRFGVFTADPQSGELRKQGMRLKLQERPFQLLIALLERPGEVVTREELRQRLWPDGTFVDFDHSVSSAINKLRSVLNDSATHPRYIETVGRRGYRFLAEVQPASANQAVLEEVRKEAQPSLVPRRRPLQVRIWAIALGTLVIVAAVLTGYLWTRPRPRSSATQRVMLAVLPFDNLTGDPGEDYFSDGLTEEMITELGGLNPGRLGVIARTSVMLYKRSPKPLEQIGRELGVQYVIEGSVRRDSANVRITAQLIQVKDQTHLWARQYDRELKNLLIVQREIAQEITDEIQLSLGDQPRVNAVNRRPVVAISYEAYELYLKGRYFWNKRTWPGFKQAAEYFQQAIAKDPNYARAYAGLADTFGLMSVWNMAPPNEFMPKARTAALKALELDESLAEAHASLALIAENYDYDWQTAEKEFRRAIQLNPEYATAHQWYAEYLSWQGRFDEAFAEIERARRLDPMSQIIATDYGAILFFSRQYDRAIAQCRAVLDMDPGSGYNPGRAQGFLFDAYVQQGRFSEALEQIGREDQPWVWAQRAYLYSRWGREAQAQRALARFERVAPKAQFARTPIELLAYVGTAQKDKVIALLQKAYLEHSPAVTTLKINSDYDPLRADPRFQELLRRIGLDR